MDEASLPALSSLLTGSTPPPTRAAACSAIAASTSAPAAAGLRRVIGTTAAGDVLLRRLLLLSGDAHCARLALSALVNLSEDEAAAAALTRAGAVRRAAQAVLDADGVALHAALLSNLTRFAPGVDALVGAEGADGVRERGTLLALVERVPSMPNVLWLSNACASRKGRDALLVGGRQAERQPLTRLLRLLDAGEAEKRLAAASGVRNCAMADECHDVLVGGTAAVAMCLGRLKEVGGEEMAEIRVLLVEAVLLLCKSRVGRDALRDGGAVDVLEGWKGGKSMHAVESILDRLAVAEEGEDVDVTEAIAGLGGGFVQPMDGVSPV